jgi:hypothetical protein
MVVHSFSSPLPFKSSLDTSNHFPKDLNSLMSKIHLAKCLSIETACLEENLLHMLLIILHIIKDFQPVKSILKIYFPLEIEVAFGLVLG